MLGLIATADDEEPLPIVFNVRRMTHIRRNDAVPSIPHDLDSRRVLRPALSRQQCACFAEITPGGEMP